MTCDDMVVNVSLVSVCFVLAFVTSKKGKEGVSIPGKQVKDMVDSLHG